MYRGNAKADPSRGRRHPAGDPRQGSAGKSRSRGGDDSSRAALAELALLKAGRGSAADLWSADPSIDKRQLAAVASKLMPILADAQKSDGSWVDSANYTGPFYGTAYAAMALKNFSEVAALKEPEAR